MYHIRSQKYIKVQQIKNMTTNPIPTKPKAQFNAQYSNANPYYPISNFKTSIILGNSNSNRVEVYTVKFSCNWYGCSPQPVQRTDLIWSSPIVEGISEVKQVIYNGRSAVLATTNNGAIVYDYPSNYVLFHKEISPQRYVNIHSAEVLPDGNVVIAGSTDDGTFGILYPDGNNIYQDPAATTWVNSAPYGHGIVFDKARNRLYAGGYLTILIMEYNGQYRWGQLTIIKTVSIEQYYNKPNFREDANTEDGIHDMYPVDGDPDNVFVTTGEHAFTFNINDYSIRNLPSLYTIPSKLSQENAVTVKGKGGLKAISKDANANVVFARSSPWFRELKSNYDEKGPILIWSMPKETPNNGFCYSVDYDLTSNCKINFDQLKPIRFYKARVFKI